MTKEVKRVILLVFPSVFSISFVQLLALLTGDFVRFLTFVPKAGAQMKATKGGNGTKAKRVKRRPREPFGRCASCRRSR